MAIEAVSAQASKQAQPAPKVDRQEERRDAAKADQAQADRKARDEAQGSEQISVDA